MSKKIMSKKKKASFTQKKVWIVWDTEYVNGVAYEQIRAICTRKWIADVNAQIVRKEARNHGRRALIEVRSTLLNHLFGWRMLLKLNKNNPLNPNVGTTEDFERKLEQIEG